MRTNPRTHLRSPNRILLLVVVALIASSLATLAVVAGTTSTAHACSIGPVVEVWPSSDLRPGQEIEIVGRDFYDIRMHELISPDDPDRATPPQLCDFDLIPINDLDVHWQGNRSAYLGSVAGPDFVLIAAVPQDATAGPAAITVAGAEAVVTVGGSTEPPQPPPCPLHGADGTQPAPAADYVPGFQPPCPEPCVDYAHTTDDGTVYDYQWDCPDPCSQIQVSPGAGDQALGIWCPPEPCPVYFDGRPAQVAPPMVPGCPDPCEVVGGDAVWCPPEPCPLFPAGPGEFDEALAWCPPPEPCPLNLHGAPVPDVALVHCPDPCGAVGGDAVWCPPEPCPLFPAGPDEFDEALAWCPPPEPCPLYTASSGDTAELSVWCPPKCELVGGDALVCPEPCGTSPVNLQPCPAPCADPNTGQFCAAIENAPAPTSLPAPNVPTELDGSTADSDPIVTTAATQTEPTSTEATELHASNAVLNIIELMIRRIAEALGSARLTLFN